MGIFSSKKKGQTNKSVESQTQQDPAPSQVEPAKMSASSITVNNEPAPSTIVNDPYLVMGKLIRLMSIAPEFRKMPLGEVIATVAPAITMGQVLIAETQINDSKTLSPTAFALWASVSPEIDQRLSEAPDQPWGLTPQDWKSGDIPWLILAVGDERIVSGLLNAFITQTLDGKELKTRGRDGSGKIIATTIRVTPIGSQ